MSEPDLTDLERRLSAWRPASDRLDADAVLFAAGRASVPRSPARFAWPMIAVCLAVAVGFTGNRLIAERAVNRELAARLQSTDTPIVVDVRPLTLPESSFLSARRALERDPDSWVSQMPVGEAALTPDAGLHAGQREWDLDR